MELRYRVGTAMHNISLISVLTVRSFEHLTHRSIARLVNDCTAEAHALKATGRFGVLRTPQAHGAKRVLGKETNWGNGSRAEKTENKASYFIHYQEGPIFGMCEDDENFQVRISTVSARESIEGRGEGKRRKKRERKNERREILQRCCSIHVPLKITLDFSIKQKACHISYWNIYSIFLQASRDI